MHGAEGDEHDIESKIEEEIAVTATHEAMPEKVISD